LIAVICGQSCATAEDATAGGFVALFGFVSICLGWLPLWLQAEVTHARNDALSCEPLASSSTPLGCLERAIRLSFNHEVRFLHVRFHRLSRPQHHRMSSVQCEARLTRRLPVVRTTLLIHGCKATIWKHSIFLQTREVVFPSLRDFADPLNSMFCSSPFMPVSCLVPLFRGDEYINMDEFVNHGEVEQRKWRLYHCFRWKLQKSQV
jgi:hypothetical protein